MDVRQLLIIQYVRGLVKRHMWQFFYEMVPDARISCKDREEAERLGILAKFEAYMKAHEADWYCSGSFEQMFQKCPITHLPTLAAFFYGDGTKVAAGVNLSDRVIECLTKHGDACTQEQAAFPRAAVIQATIDTLGRIRSKYGKQSVPTI